MFNLRELDDCCVWPEHLTPEGYGDHLVEPFEAWWGKHSKELSHLPKEVLKQWVYRHWSDSIATFLPLERLSCSEEVWPAIDFIEKVGTLRGNEPMDPEHDYDAFSGRLDGRKKPVAIALDQGEWDYAPIVLSTPDGFIDGIQEHIITPYFLIEGHKRRRYLNALLHKGLCIKDQRIFVLTTH
ncbi:MAG: hypothetical protein K8F25_18425 [Fimbriimonadaceae bacterium]|nr:hypothetical protein [Alphaproteobacteria bacterium]